MDSIETTLAQEPALSIEVNVPDEPVDPHTINQTLAERFGFAKRGPVSSQVKKPVRRGGSRGKKTDNLLTTVIPTILASFIATYSKQLLPAEYKRCAPSMEECNAMLSPLLAMIARRVELTGQASQDVIDVVNSLVAGLAYGTRAFMIYVEVKAEKEPVKQHAQNNTRPDDNRGTNSATLGRTDQDQDSRTAQSIGASHASNGEWLQYSTGVIDGIAGAQNVPDENGHSETQAIRDLLERDKRGRIRLGLLPGELQ